MAQSNTYRVGVIGGGAIAQACHLPGYRRHPNARLVAVADPVEARHGEIEDAFGPINLYTDYRTMLAKEQLDVVSVCSPNKYHAAHTIAALNAKCHVLCEKPIAVTLREAGRMIEAARKNRRKLMIGFTHRLLSGPRRCKELLQDGAIGKPFMARVRFAHGGPLSGWAKDAWFHNKVVAAGGALLDMGIHAIDLCHWLIGPVAEVHARTMTFVKNKDVDDNAVVLLRFKSGALGYIEVGWTSKPGFSGLEIYGTDGTLICDYIKGLQLCSGKASAGKDSSSQWTMLDDTPTRGGWDIEIDHWMDIVMGKQKLTMTGKAGRDALAVALAAYQSDRTGKRIIL